MTTLTLLEFQELTGLSDSSLAYFLKSYGHLCTVDPSIGIQIDSDALETKKALDHIFELRRESWKVSKESIQAMISRIVGEKMDSILSESLEPLLQDQTKSDND